MMNENKDELSRMRAELDQGVEAMREMAKGFGTFHATLVEHGLTSKQAFELTKIQLRGTLLPSSSLDALFRGLGGE